MKVLLHICCAVCATWCVEKLRQQGYQLTGYFYNPNIQPQEEYLKRLVEVKRLAKLESFPLIFDNYDTDEWFGQIKGLELEPEGGRRCAGCFRLRLERTLGLARERGFPYFTTTLTVSPHKNAQVINEIGEAIGNGLFLARDFKKQDGFKKAQALARDYNLYRQNYCGCVYSNEASQD